jgi:hypothetical protein
LFVYFDLFYVGLAWFREKIVGYIILLL